MPVPFPAVNAFDRHPPPSFPAHLTVILVQTGRRDVRGHRPGFRGLSGGRLGGVPAGIYVGSVHGRGDPRWGLRTDQRSRGGHERHKHQTANAAAGTTISIEARIRGRLRLSALFHCLSDGSTDLRKLDSAAAIGKEAAVADAHETFYALQRIRGNRSSRHEERVHQAEELKRSRSLVNWVVSKHSILNDGSGHHSSETAAPAQIQELMLRKLAPNTRRAWFRSLTNFGCSLGRSPDTAEARGLEK